MKSLIQRGLMFGNLIHIDSPALVDRYNRALEHLTDTAPDGCGDHSTKPRRATAQMRPTHPGGILV